MSGGSYNHLWVKDADELMDAQNDLERMSSRLAGLKYAQDAAEETEELLLIIRQSLNRIRVRSRRLSGIWAAVEKWDSMDTGEDAVRRALAKYRGED